MRDDLDEVLWKDRPAPDVHIRQVGHERDRLRLCFRHLLYTLGSASLNASSWIEPQHSFPQRRVPYNEATRRHRPLTRLVRMKVERLEQERMESGVEKVVHPDEADDIGYGT